MNAGVRASGFSDPIGLGPVPSFWLVVFAEVFCAGLVVVGLLTRLSVLPILGFLTVAGFIQHAHDPWPRREPRPVPDWRRAVLAGCDAETPRAVGWEAREFLNEA